MADMATEVCQFCILCNTINFYSLKREKNQSMACFLLVFLFFFSNGPFYRCHAFSNFFIHTKIHLIVQWNGGFTLRTYQLFFIHTTWEEFRNNNNNNTWKPLSKCLGIFGITGNWWQNIKEKVTITDYFRLILC